MREWIYGRNPVFETLRSRRRQVFRLLLAEGVEERGNLPEALKLAEARKLKPERVPRGQLDRLLGENHQGIGLEVSAYPYAGLRDILDSAGRRGEAPFVLALDMIQNPQNLGTLLRTAEAVGIHGVILPLRRSAEVTPAVVSASAGASEHLLVAQANLAQALDELKEAGAWAVGLEGASPQAQPPERCPLGGPLVLVVGNEGEGMRELVRKKCDVLMALPMRGKVDSLNAAVAGSIALYLARTARDRKSN